MKISDKKLLKEQAKIVEKSVKDYNILVGNLFSYFHLDCTKLIEIKNKQKEIIKTLCKLQNLLNDIYEQVTLYNEMYVTFNKR
jgi:hypothetical protein